MSDNIWPIVCCIMVCTAFFTMSSCQEQRQTQHAITEQQYLKAGCEKTAIPGSSGTHWVCSKK